MMVPGILSGRRIVGMFLLLSWIVVVVVVGFVFFVVAHRSILM